MTMPHLSERFNPCTDTDTDMTKADRIDKLEAIREEQNAKIGELQAEVERLFEAATSARDALRGMPPDYDKGNRARRALTNALDAAEDAHE